MPRSPNRIGGTRLAQLLPDLLSRYRVNLTPRGAVHGPPYLHAPWPLLRCDVRAWLRVTSPSIGATSSLSQARLGQSILVVVGAASLHAATRRYLAYLVAS